ncbi:MAG: MBL fold metallo-hydrolase [Patescibacteria group bacterium]
MGLLRHYAPRNGNELKMNSPKKLLIIIIILTALGMAACLFLYQEKEKLLEVVFMDVGQGDAILIKTPYDQQILIDGGPDNQVLQKLGQHMPFWDRSIDLLILTHPHSDHVGGLPAVMDRYQVEQIFYTGVLHTSPDYLAWLQKIEEQAVDLKITKSGDRVNLGNDLYLDTLFPLEDYTNQEVEDLNGTSVVNKLVYGQHAFLLTGDLPAEQELAVLNQGINVTADVLKVGHHGSKYSSSSEFLSDVDPQYAIVQVGQDNKFGHPHLVALNNIESSGAVILRSDKLGDIKCQSDKSVLSCF